MGRGSAAFAEQGSSEPLSHNGSCRRNDSAVHSLGTGGHVKTVAGLVDRLWAPTWTPADHTELVGFVSHAERPQWDSVWVQDSCPVLPP